MFVFWNVNVKAVGRWSMNVHHIKVTTILLHVHEYRSIWGFFHKPGRKHMPCFCFKLFKWIKRRERKSWNAMWPLVAYSQPTSIYINVCVCTWVQPCVKSALVCVAAVMSSGPCGCRWHILASFASVCLCEPVILSCDMAIYSASSSAQAIHTSSPQMEDPTVICEDALW